MVAWEIKFEHNLSVIILGLRPTGGLVSNFSVKLMRVISVCQKKFPNFRTVSNLSLKVTLIFFFSSLSVS